jgi:hypothetical protein
MRRPGSNLHIGAAFTDVKLNFSSAQLAGIGAVILAWNEVENHLAYAFQSALRLPSSIAREVALQTRFDKQIDFLKQLAENRTCLPEILEPSVKEALRKVRECKAARDAIAHARVFHAEHGVGQMENYNARRFEVLLTEEALSAFYDLLVVLAAEIEAVNAVFGTIAITPAKVENPERDGRHSEQMVAHWGTKLVEAQARRQSMKPLPDFPELPAMSQIAEGLWAWFPPDERAGHDE